jgi:hypothetical protein
VPLPPSRPVQVDPGPSSPGRRLKEPDAATGAPKCLGFLRCVVGYQALQTRHWKMGGEAHSSRRVAIDQKSVETYLGFCVSPVNFARLSAALGDAIIQSSLSPPVTNSSPLFA